ncbi:MAG TPA: Kiwa anti-phage protein KwaB-like domain-containing protein [Bacteroidia bacterium]|nr:Kiwa anti-phage protein KwaB-like domain-containing protein [Bacteroidia bacterium]
MRAKFRNLKQLNLQDVEVSLAIVREYKKNRISQYNISYVQIDRPLEKRLKQIISRKIATANTFEPYTFDCPEPEEDLLRAINYESTDFFRIYEQLVELNPEENIIVDVNELIKAKAYLIVLRDTNGVQVVGFKTLPENWKMKRDKGLIPLLFKENRFEDLEDENVFSISGTIDIIYYDEVLFILSKKDFEAGLNFREGMLAKAEELYQEVKQSNLFVNVDILTSKVGNNQRYLRKIATIKNLGYYLDEQYLSRLQTISIARNWNIQFKEGQIVITEDNLDAILTVLQNKRLHSELTDETFDVDSAKKLELHGN